MHRIWHPRTTLHFLSPPSSRAGFGQVVGLHPTPRRSPRHLYILHLYSSASIWDLSLSLVTDHVRHPQRTPHNTCACPARCAKYICLYLLTNKLNYNLGSSFEPAVKAKTNKFHRISLNGLNLKLQSILILYSLKNMDIKIPNVHNRKIYFHIGSDTSLFDFLFVSSLCYVFLWHSQIHNINEIRRFIICSQFKPWFSFVDVD